MTPEEAVILCRYVKAASPAQQVDEFTPTVWHDLLGDLRFEDAKEAVRDIAGRKPFVDPADIRAQVKRIRAKRLAEAVLPEPPPDLTPLETIAWLKDTRRRIADGEDVTHDYGELKPHPLPELKALMPRPDIHPTTEETR